MLSTSFCLHSQNIVKGQVLEIKTKKSIGFATITNVTSNISALSDSLGFFLLKAQRGDSVIVHALSFISDTVVIEKDIYQILLVPRNNILEDVNIVHLNLQPLSSPISPFHGQSMVYKYHYGGDDIGGVVFRVWYWKKDQKKRNRQLEMEERSQKEIEIRRIFCEDSVSKYIPLRGEELKTFIRLYMPTSEEYYAANFHLILYINDSYKKFIYKSENKSETTKNDF